jgi:hypothetical protein
MNEGAQLPLEVAPGMRANVPDYSTANKRSRTRA